ncbi:NitT/TauT family transport system permease protein [Hydrogenispora ethanolica]|uniref:NitT/TauT family transport system permease protein n=1 Tax=Hydrogenispora ethanolica TaxID=1082276 RepID=A0A4R1R899_HYDET|nr:ABC transporter permease [Hydrogenispora ethanolica]TCL61881.1 NitT/TauT family transport system permease protein [Hydrogenispora ethanolica]
MAKTANTAAGSAPAGSARSKTGISNLTLNILAIVVFFGIWIFYTSVIAPKNFLIPSPFQVIGAGVEKWQSGLLLQHVVASMYRVFTAFCLAMIGGILLGFLMGWYRVVRGMIEPFVQFFRMIPAIALIPLFILYVGIGEPSKIIVIWLSAFLTIVITVYQGIKNIDPNLIKASRVLGAKNYDIFRHIAIPASFPYILVAARLGSAASWTTLVASELIAASRGLGYMVTEAGVYFQPAVMYLGIFLIGALGLIMDKLILFLEKKLAGWQEKVA